MDQTAAGERAPLDGNAPPPFPTTVAETGLSCKFLNALVLKMLHTLALETVADVAERLKLSPSVVDQLLLGLKHQKCVEVLGSIPGNVPVLRYGLTNAGRDQALDAANQCEYVGPAPVPLTSFQTQVKKQSIANEKVTVSDLTAALSHLVVPESLIRRLGPAVNSSRSLLVYGSAGNGKTSVSESIGKVFKQPVYIPHAIEVDGQVIRVFDPTIHVELPPRDETELIIRKKPDLRWVRCRRPVILMGGELTLDVLDLQYETTAKFYEAPPQVKALGGVFIIDDFGRQLVQPKDLLNRWIVPLEKKIDYLTIHTGKKFDYPFDEMVIFSTNISPNTLMDPALLRRVKYKLRVDPPSVADYCLIFRRVCEQYGVRLDDAILDFLLEDFYPRTGSVCAAYHPIFIVEHAVAACRYMGVTPRLTLELVQDALENLYVSDSPPQERVAPLQALMNATVDGTRKG